MLWHSLNPFLVFPLFLAQVHGWISPDVWTGKCWGGGKPFFPEAPATINGFIEIVLPLAECIAPRFYKGQREEGP
jgi:hypothetical protein